MYYRPRPTSQYPGSIASQRIAKYQPNLTHMNQKLPSTLTNSLVSSSLTKPVSAPSSKTRSHTRFNSSILMCMGKAWNATPSGNNSSISSSSSPLYEEREVEPWGGGKGRRIARRYVSQFVGLWGKRTCQNGVAEILFHQRSVRAGKEYRVTFAIGKGKVKRGWTHVTWRLSFSIFKTTLFGVMNCNSRDMNSLRNAAFAELPSLGPVGTGVDTFEEEA